MLPTTKVLKYLRQQQVTYMEESNLIILISKFGKHGDMNSTFYKTNPYIRIYSVF